MGIWSAIQNAQNSDKTEVYDSNSVKSTGPNYDAMSPLLLARVNPDEFKARYGGQTNTMTSGTPVGPDYASMSPLLLFRANKDEFKARFGNGKQVSETPPAEIDILVTDDGTNVSYQFGVGNEPLPGKSIESTGSFMERQGIRLG